MNLNLHALAWPVTALGPGRRLALWVAGCRRRCPGCISPDMQSDQSGKPVDISRLHQKITGIDAALSGLTISGGEPVDQWPALALLLERVLLDRPEWNVILYTGYELSEVTALTGGTGPMVDVLIDGPYQKDIPSRNPLAGSGNQRLHYLTHKGRRLQGEIEAFSPDRFDLALGPGGESRLVGVSRPGYRQQVNLGLGGWEGSV